MPVIRTQQKIEQLQIGDVLTVHCTDPGAVHDIPAWCRVNGHAILEVATHDNEITIRIEVRDA